MSQIAAISINDGLPTPTSHTFSPQNAQLGSSEPALFLDRSGGIYSGFQRLSMLVRRSESNKATKVMLKLASPVLSVTSPSTATGIQPQPTVAYTVLCDVTFTFPDSCTLQERQNARAYLASLLNPATTIVKAAIEDLSPAY